MSTPLDHPRLDELIATATADHPELATAARAELTALEGLVNDTLALTVRAVALLSRPRGFKEEWLERKFIKHVLATFKKYGLNDKGDSKHERTEPA